MPIQTTYNFTHDALQKGMIQDFLPTERITAFSDEVINFGFGVVYDSAVGNENRPKVAIPSSTGFTFLGVACHTHKQNTGGDDTLGTLTTTEEAEYAIGDDITVLKKGRIVVYSEQAVDLDDDVYLRHTTTTTENPGDFRTDADTDKADQITQARWVSKTSGAGLAVIEINIP